MALEGIRSYLQLASGLAEMSRARATQAASALLTLSSNVSSNALSTQVQDLAEELLTAAAANRRSIVALVRGEVESAVSRASVMSIEELDRARAAMAKLSADVEELRDHVLASSAVRSIPDPGRSAVGTVSGVASMLGLGGSARGHVSANAADHLDEPMTRPAQEDLVVNAALGKPVTTVSDAATPAARARTTKKAAARSGSASKSATKTSTARASAATSGGAKARAAKTSVTKTGAAKSRAAKSGAAKTGTAKRGAAKTGTAKTGTAKKTSSTRRAGGTPPATDPASGR